MESEEESSKVFTVSDIQTLMDNQLHKSQLDQNLENKLEQQHLILVTQNGDKIILIQNPSVTADSNQPLQLNSTSLGGDNVLSLNAASSSSTAVVEANASSVDRLAITDKPHHLNSYDSESDTEFLLSNPAISNDDEENEKDEEISRIQLHHKHRQQSLMLQLERLREKHKQNSRPENAEEPEGEQPGDDGFWDFNIDEINEYEQQKSNHKSNKPHVKKKSVPLEKFYCEAKWYPSFCNNLEKAHNYVRRRSENIEQLSKYFPIASFAFENRCAELKKHLKKLELNLERFQNVLGKDLNFVESKLKNFFHDYHLESFSAVIEDEDRKDLEESPDGQNAFFNHLVNTNYLNGQPTASSSKSFASSSQLNHHPNCSAAAAGQSYRSGCKNSSFISSKIEPLELITPMSISISITPAEQHDEIDPVPEIRDVRCDASLEEMGDWYSNNVNLNKPPYASNVSIKAKKANIRRTKDDHSKPAKQPKRS